MTDILEKLYFGEVRSAEKEIGGNAMKDKLNKMIEIEEEVMKSLDDEARVMFERYLAMSSDVHADALVDSYKEGFKTAVRLILAGLVE